MASTHDELAPRLPVDGTRARRLHAAVLTAPAAAAAAGGAAAGALYLTIGDAAVKAAFVAAVSTIAAVISARAARRHPSARGPLGLLAAAQGTWAVGWLAWAAVLAATGAAVDASSPVFSVFLPTYPLLAAVLLLLVARREDSAGGLIDSTIIALALFEVAWVVLLGSYLHDSRSVMGKVNPIAYAVGDVAVVAAAVRLLTSRGRRSLVYWLLIAAAVAPVVSDGFWNWGTALGNYSLGSWADEGWLLLPVAAAVAALHPRIGLVFRVRPRTEETLGVLRLLLLSAAAAAGPVLLVVDASPYDKIPVAAAASATIVLILVRLRQMIVRGAALMAEIAAQNRRLHESAITDPLTGLANRTLLADRLQQALLRRRGRGGEVAVLFVDLDDFKLVNDSLGHASGDDVLRATGEKLRLVLRATDTVARAPALPKTSEHGVIARLGGDEFVVLLTDLVDARDAAAVAERIQDGLSEPVVVAGREFRLGASIGITASREGDDRDAEALIRDADIAMYAAKRSGKSSFCFFETQMYDEVVARGELVRTLRSAIENDELCLLYQPQVDLSSERITAVEALVRWNHPDQGLLPPSAFIPVAEETGTITALDEWVFEHACRQVSNWRAEGIDVRVAVNVSARSAVERAAVDTFAAILRRYGVAGDAVEIEITETAAVLYTDEALSGLDRLRRLGVTVAIDDFGVGQSALSRLHAFPVDRLKIDRAFIAPLTAETGDRSLAAAMIAMGHSLDLAVVAEGVESRTQLRALRRLGCGSAQGYLFARPLPVDEIDQLLRGEAGVLPSTAATDTDDLVRNLLAELQRLTGLESTYLTQIDEPSGVQRIVSARNIGALQIPENLEIPWADTVCRRALEQDVRCTDEVDAVFGDSDAARELGLQTYAGVPIRDASGVIVGTLCGASTRRIAIDPKMVVVMQRFAELIAQRTLS